MLELYYKCMVMGLKFCERKDVIDYKLYVIIYVWRICRNDKILLLFNRNILKIDESLIVRE